MSWGMAELQRHISQGVALAVGDARRLEFGLGDRGVHDRCPGGLGQLEVTGQEVGVEVGFDDEFDRVAELLGIGKILGHVTLWVHNDCAPGGFVSDQVRSVGEAVQVVLGEFHGVSPFARRMGSHVCLQRAHTPMGMSSTLGGI